MSPSRMFRVASPWLLSLAAGCLPYTVGTTAQTVPVGERRVTTSLSYVIGSGSEYDSTRGGGRNIMAVSDAEVRLGVTDNADVGLRLTSLSGFVVNLKTRHTDEASPDAPAFATMLGAGIVNVGDHAMVEGTLLWSGRRRGELLPYGGLRAMQVFPLNRDAVEDTPSIGALLGLRLGNDDSYFAPELAIYYDRSALKNRSTNWLVVPGVTLRGIRFPRRFSFWRSPAAAR